MIDKFTNTNKDLVLLDILALLVSAVKYFILTLDPDIEC